MTVSELKAKLDEMGDDELIVVADGTEIRHVNIEQDDQGNPFVELT